MCIEDFRYGTVPFTFGHPIANLIFLGTSSNPSQDARSPALLPRKLTPGVAQGLLRSPDMLRPFGEPGVSRTQGGAYSLSKGSMALDGVFGKDAHDEQEQGLEVHRKGAGKK